MLTDINGYHVKIIFKVVLDAIIVCMVNYLVWRLQFVFQSEELFQKANCEERRTHEVSPTGGSLWTHQTQECI